MPNSDDNDEEKESSSEEEEDYFWENKYKDDENYLGEDVFKVEAIRRNVASLPFFPCVWRSSHDTPAAPFRARQAHQ